MTNEVWQDQDPAAYVRRTFRFSDSYCTQHERVQFVDGQCTLCLLERDEMDDDRSPPCGICHRRECSH